MNRVSDTAVAQVESVGALALVLVLVLALVLGLIDEWTHVMPSAEAPSPGEQKKHDDRSLADRVPGSQKAQSASSSWRLASVE